MEKLRKQQVGSQRLKTLRSELLEDLDGPRERDQESNRSTLSKMQDTVF